MTTRLLCISSPSYPIQVPPPPVPASGARFYNAPGATVSQGSVLDVPGDTTDDVATLLSTGCFVVLGQVGATSARPIYPRAGEIYVDTTVGTALWFDGTAWRDATGSSH